MSPQSPICLSLHDVECIYAAYSREGARDLEDLPSLNYRYDAELEGILVLPKAGMKNTLFYPSLPEQGAVLFYEVIKQHPFYDGNKRMACLILFTFLYLNDGWLNLSNNQLYTMAHTVACSDPEDRDSHLSWLQTVIAENKVTLEGKEGQGFRGFDIGRWLNTLNPFSR